MWESAESPKLLLSLPLIGVLGSIVHKHIRAPSRIPKGVADIIVTEGYDGREFHTAGQSRCWQAFHRGITAPPARLWGGGGRERSATSHARRRGLADRCRFPSGCHPTTRGRLHPGVPFATRSRETSNNCARRSSSDIANSRWRRAALSTIAPTNPDGGSSASVNTTSASLSSVIFASPLRSARASLRSLSRLTRVSAGR